MPVGIGFGTQNRNRQQIRMDPNPMDKCTIVSAYHKDILADKPTIFPGKFIVPKASDNEFEILVVGPSSWWKETDEHQPLLEMYCSSYQVANAIVNDYVSSLFGAKGHAQKPAVFVTLGEWDKTNIATYIDKVSKKPFKKLLDEARKAQDLYYDALIQAADVGWARTNGNPLAVSDDARLAAVKRKVDKNKPWMQDFKTMELVNCKACGHLVNDLYPICPNCKMPIAGIPIGAALANSKTEVKTGT